MTKDKTVTMSRELIEKAAHRLSDLGQSHISEPMFAAILAAPVVERQEPAEWRYRFTHCGELSKWFPVDSYMKLYAIGNDPAYEIQPLYTSPPAPVSVVLPSPDDLRYLISRAAKHADLTNGANFYTAAEFAAEALIDKVKELNQ